MFRKNLIQIHQNYFIYLYKHKYIFSQYLPHLSVEIPTRMLFKKKKKIKEMKEIKSNLKIIILCSNQLFLLYIDKKR